MKYKKRGREVIERSTSAADISRGRVFSLLEKMIESIESAGPVGWVSMVAAIGFAAIVLVVYIMAAPMGH